MFLDRIQILKKMMKLIFQIMVEIDKLHAYFSSEILIGE